MMELKWKVICENCGKIIKVIAVCREAAIREATSQHKEEPKCIHGPLIIWAFVLEETNNP